MLFASGEGEHLAKHRLKLWGVRAFREVNQAVPCPLKIHTELHQSAMHFGGCVVCWGTTFSAKGNPPFSGWFHQIAEACWGGTNWGWLLAIARSLQQGVVHPAV